MWLGMPSCTHEITNPAFADHIALVATHKPLLQKMLNIAFNFSAKWRFDFNAGKSEILIFGNDTCPNRGLTLGPQTVDIKQCSPYMGVPHSNSSMLKT